MSIEICRRVVKYISGLHFRNAYTLDPGLLSPPEFQEITHLWILKSRCFASQAETIWYMLTNDPAEIITLFTQHQGIPDGLHSSDEKQTSRWR